MTGCSTKSNFYQLHTPQTEQKQGTSHLRHTVIGIGEVSLPAYLDKPQVVTRITQGRLQINETERWAGELDKNIQSVVSDNLSALLPQYTFMNAPWDEPVQDRYRIYITIDRFDGDNNGVVTLKGRWSLVDREENKLITGEVIDFTQKGEVGMDGLVTTQSRVLQAMSKQIAQKIRRYL